MAAIDVRAFRTAVLTDKVAAPVSMAMRAALAEAKTVTDTGSSNEKLAKSPGRASTAVADVTTWRRR